MPNLSIKDVPEPLAERLRQQARRHHRSLQGELMAILERAVNDTPQPSRQTPPAALDGSVFLQGSQTIEETAAELRRLLPHPVTSGPLAVDIIRAERDAR